MAGYFAGFADDNPAIVAAGARGGLKHALVKIGLPVEDLAGYTPGSPLDVQLRTSTADGTPWAQTLSPVCSSSRTCRPAPLQRGPGMASWYSSRHAAWRAGGGQGRAVRGGSRDRGGAASSHIDPGHTRRGCGLQGGNESTQRERHER